MNIYKSAKFGMTPPRPTLAPFEKDPFFLLASPLAIQNDSRAEVEDWEALAGDLASMHELDELLGNTQVFVRGLDGLTFTIEVARSETVTETKAKISAKIGVASNTFYLQHEGRIVSEEETLAGVGVQGGSHLQMLGRLLGGMLSGGSDSQISDATELENAVELSCMDDDEGVQFLRALAESREQARERRQGSSSTGDGGSASSSAPHPMVEAAVSRHLEATFGGILWCNGSPECECGECVRGGSKVGTSEPGSGSAGSSSGASRHASVGRRDISLQHSV